MDTRGSTEGAMEGAMEVERGRVPSWRCRGETTAETTYVHCVLYKYTVANLYDRDFWMKLTKDHPEGEGCIHVQLIVFL